MHRCDPRSDEQCDECYQRQLAEEREAEAMPTTPEGFDLRCRLDEAFANLDADS